MFGGVLAFCVTTWIDYAAEQGQKAGICQFQAKVADPEETSWKCEVKNDECWCTETIMKGELRMHQIPWGLILPKELQ